MAKKKRKASSVDAATEMMVLTEYARNPKPRDIARRFGLANHMQVTRMWNRLPPDVQEQYRTNAQDINDAVSDKILQRDYKFVEQTADRMVELMNKSLDEYERRINDAVLKEKIPARELTGFVRLAQGFIMNNVAGEDDGQETAETINVFNIIDHAINESIDINNGYED